MSTEEGPLALPPFLRVPGAAEVDPGGPSASRRWTADGIPILLADPAPWLASLGEDVDAPLDRLSFSALAYLSRYLPQLLAPHAPLRKALRFALERHLPAKARLAVELGCSVGADLRMLSTYAEAVVGIDLAIAGLRAAQTHLDGEPIPFLRRVEGRSFATEDPIHLPALDNILVAVGDAYDPPLYPGTVDVVLASNLLDTVARPLALIAAIDRLLAPGGLLLLTSPFAWNEEITPPEEALGGGTAEAWATLGTAAGLVELLAGRVPLMPQLRYEVLEQHDVPWTLREHARAVTHYDVHVLVAKKGAADAPPS